MNRKIAQEDLSMKAIRGDKDVPKEYYILNIQKLIGEFPWESFDLKNPNVRQTKVMDNLTQKALVDLEKISNELGSFSLRNAINKIQAGDFKGGSDNLFDANMEIRRLIKQDDDYVQRVGDKKWSSADKLKFIQSSKFPNYFPKPWQPKNMGMNVGGKEDKKYTCGPWQPYAQFRSCATPYYNHFLMWGPSCPQCGTVGPDPRLSKIKNRYPGAWTYEKVKERLEKHMWSPLIPSPGVAPWVGPPPKGSPYYEDPNNPNTEIEGVRFFDREDESEYYKYLDLYNEFKENEMKNAELLKYQEQFFKHYAYKLKKSLYKSPNEWSSDRYGRTASSIFRALIKNANKFSKLLK